MTLSERLAILDGRSNSNEPIGEGSIIADEYVAIARKAVSALSYRDMLLKDIAEYLHSATGHDYDAEFIRDWLDDYEAMKEDT